METVEDIRKYFISELNNERFTISANGEQTIELLGASFKATEESIFGIKNDDYINSEIEWYNSMSTNINDIYCCDKEPPNAWKYTANKHGEINSNYGKLIFSNKYHNQFINALSELKENQDSRRAIMVYTRPSIWDEYNENGKNDFICTNAQTFYIRDGKIHLVSQMRSNDVWAGYRNDYAWAKYLLDKMQNRLYLSGLTYEVGDIYWQVQNLHVYSKNFYLVDAYSKGHETITKKEYKKLYPSSKYI